MQRQDQAQMLSPMSTHPQEPNRSTRHSILLGLIFIFIVAMLPPRQSPPTTDRVIPHPMAIAPPSSALGSGIHEQQIQLPTDPIQPEIEPLTTRRAALAHSTHRH